MSLFLLGPEENPSATFRESKYVNKKQGIYSKARRSIPYIFYLLARARQRRDRDDHSEEQLLLKFAARQRIRHGH
jgi:hypothetical protein